MYVNGTILRNVCMGVASIFSGQKGPREGQVDEKKNYLVYNHVFFFNMIYKIFNNRFFYGGGPFRMGPYPPLPSPGYAHECVYIVCTKEALLCSQSRCQELKKRNDFFFRFVSESIGFFKIVFMP